MYCVTFTFTDELVSSGRIVRVTSASILARGSQYALINQRTRWVSDGVDVGSLFKDYKQRRKAPMDIAQDDIINFTTDSPFLASIDDAAFNAVVLTFPRAMRV